MDDVNTDRRGKMASLGRGTIRIKILKERRTMDDGTNAECGLRIEIPKTIEEGRLSRLWRDWEDTC
jgi:hypothetical protein